MQFDRTWSVTAAPAELRSRALDADGRRAAHAHDGSRRVRVVTEQVEHGTVVRLGRDVPTGARGAAAIVVGRFLALEQTERWDTTDADGRVTARLLVTFGDRPIVVTGRIELTPTPTGSAHRLSGEVEARVPGVGGLLERRIVSQMFADLTRQLGTGRP